MAEDDDNLDDLKFPPHTNEDADTQLDAKALKLVEEYVASLNRSKNENTVRGEIRGNILKLGIHTLAFQHELTAQKMMDAEDRRHYMAGRRRMGRVLADKQGVLFADELERIKKRKEKAKEKAAKEAAAAGKETKEQQERRLAADSNPKSKPKASSAVKPPKAPKAAGSAADRAAETSERNQRLAETQAASPGASATLSDTVAAGDALIAKTAAELTAEQEQRDGAALLNRNPDGTPKSQSQIAAEIAAQAGTDKPIVIR